MKNYLLFSFSLVLLLSGCEPPATPGVSKSDYKTIQGKAQGTTYTLTFQDSSGTALSQNQTDSIFNAIDRSLSLWVENSTIRRFNDSTQIDITDPHFLEVYFRAQEVSALTNGAFEPMILPLVKYWGFGPDGAYKKMDGELEPLLDLVHKPLKVDFDSSKVESGIVEVSFSKLKGQSIDVNGIAQGYAVDVLSEFMESRGIENYMAELGGEVRCKGKNASDEFWRVGVDKPVSLEEERSIQLIISLENQSLVTSGSYRKFYESDGKKYSHTIDPSTGKPVEHNLLSVSVLASNCTNADAFATAFMVMGVESTKAFLEDNPQLGIEVYMIFSTNSVGTETYMSSGLKAISEEV